MGSLGRIPVLRSLQSGLLFHKLLLFFGGNGGGRRKKCHCHLYSQNIIKK